MIVTIDGPAGAGKSSVARELARRLGFRFLDTGAMYRAVALAALRSQNDPADADRMSELVRNMCIDVTQDRVMMNGEDVTDQIRSWDVTTAVAVVADHGAVREKLVQWQREAAGAGNLVTEGRDQGTVVFPDAGCKIFLTASPGERAQRRWRDLRQRGQQLELAEVLQRQELRDARDRDRPFGALVPAEDAVHVDTDGLQMTQVVDKLQEIVRSKTT